MGIQENYDDACQQANFVNSMNKLYNPSKSDSTDYLTKGEPLYELTEEDKVSMADMVLSSMLTGHLTSVAKVRIDSSVKPIK